MFGTSSPLAGRSVYSSSSSTIHSSGGSSSRPRCGPKCYSSDRGARSPNMTKRGGARGQRADRIEPQRYKGNSSTHFVRKRTRFLDDDVQKRILNFLYFFEHREAYATGLFTTITTERYDTLWKQEHVHQWTIAARNGYRVTELIFRKVNLENVVDLFELLFIGQTKEAVFRKTTGLTALQLSSSLARAVASGIIFAPLYLKVGPNFPMTEELSTSLVEAGVGSNMSFDDESKCLLFCDVCEEHCFNDETLQCENSYSCDNNVCSECRNTFVSCEICGHEKFQCKDCANVKFCEKCYKKKCWDCAPVAFCDICEHDMCQDCERVDYCEKCDKHACRNCDTIRACLCNSGAQFKCRDCIIETGCSWFLSD